MTFRKHFVVVKAGEQGNGYDRGWLLSLEGKTMKEARAAIAWQRKLDNGQEYLIAQPSPIPGIMEQDGRPVLIDQGPYTARAFADACVSLWGTSNDLL